MIDWRIGPNFEDVKGRNWFFPSFKIQELLLPQINVGMDYIDEYNDTNFNRDDCLRLKGNIEYLLDSIIYKSRPQVKFDTLNKGVVPLSCKEITGCLATLYEAADLAIQKNETLRFLGD